MKTISFLLLFIFISLMSIAQDTWMVYHNKIEILNTGKSDPAQNIIPFKQSDLVVPGFLELKYIEEKPQKNLIRHLVVYDGSENILIQKAGVSVLTLPNETLKDLLAKNSIIKIYTWTLPTDPELAARIRVRRLHLCTVELK